MNYYGAKEMAESFRTVRNNTVTVAEDIPENRFGYRPAPECRSVAETLVHIAQSNRVQHTVHAVERRTTLAGIDFPKMIKEMHEEEKKPRSKAEIIDLLKSSGESWAKWLEGLSEDFLAERVTIPHGPVTSKSRFEMLLSVKEHEMHHRGQLMQTERLLGIVPHLTRQMNERMAAAQAAR